MAAQLRACRRACNPRRLCCSTVTEAAGCVAQRREPEAGLSARLNGLARQALIGPCGFEWRGFHLTEQRPDLSQRSAGAPTARTATEAWVAVHPRSPQDGHPPQGPWL